jgi:hypothetical protein
LPDEVAEKVYPAYVLPRLRRELCLTGYVPQRLLGSEPIPLAERTIDVFYRSRRLPYYLGSAGQVKSDIVDRFHEPLRRAGLNVDASVEESDRLYGNAWIDRLRQSRTVLGVESAVSVFDFTGQCQARFLEHDSVQPYQSFEEAATACFPGIDGQLRIGVISPRCFEAAALHVPMVLASGNYSGILEPWRHFIPLAMDGSNIEEVICAIKNDELLIAMARRAYVEVATNEANSYATFVHRFDEVCWEEVRGRNTHRSALDQDGIQQRINQAIAAKRLFALEGPAPHEPSSASPRPAPFGIFIPTAAGACETAASPPVANESVESTVTESESTENAVSQSDSPASAAPASECVESAPLVSDGAVLTVEPVKPLAVPGIIVISRRDIRLFEATKQAARRTAAVSARILRRLPSPVRKPLNRAIRLSGKVLLYVADRF